MRDDLLGLDLPAFSAWLGQAEGHDTRFHRATYRALMATGVWDPAGVADWNSTGTDPTALLARLAALARREQLPRLVRSVSAEDPEYGTTTKLALALGDGREVEAVSIPMTNDGHSTVCVSSQVGCRMGCGFCRTARMGLVRNLSAHEIVGQAVAVAVATGRRPRNLVFMGMGEPLDNAEAVEQAVRVVTGPCSFGMAWNHVTISTVGRTAALARLPGTTLIRANLALSLHAADDAVRAALVPPARLEPVAEIRRVLGTLPWTRKKRLMVSVVVIPGVTDTPALLRALIAWCAGLPALVNLIPFNPFPGCDPSWRAPTADEMLVASAQLHAAGVPVRKRITKGVEVLAACGQLATAGRKPLPA